MSDDFAPKSEFLATLIARGFVHQCSDFSGLDTEARKSGFSAYIGFDCTAPSLHVGNLVSIMLLSWLQRTGGKPLPLIGGGTTRVGDPSGKDESRKLLTVEQIEANKASIKTAFEKFLRFGDGAGDALMLDNAEWLARLNYIEILRDVGRHFSVNRMLTMDSVQLRLEREQEMTSSSSTICACRPMTSSQINKRHGCRAADGRLRPMGQYRHGHRSRPPHGHARSCTR